ncbi:nuclease, partial [uncultured Salinisphaera sp.]|uniref:nuclease n=1 Tax=uncultured Salinisphaera sp. TaxID=359372 RepID=UPI0032B19FF7
RSSPRNRCGLSNRSGPAQIAPDGGLVVVELKRDRTPREVVAQALDYASWVGALETAEIAAIYGRFNPNGTLASDFRARFNQPLDEDTLNDNHQIVIVAASLDPSTERIVNYLNGRNVPINVVFFQVFETDDTQLLSRTWLIDPGETQLNAAASGRTEREPWNGEVYVSFGHDDTRDWGEARQHGFVCAGGGSWYSNTLNALESGPRIWAKIPGTGFVGVGRVTGPRVAAADFQLQNTNGEWRPAMDVLEHGHYHHEYIDDPDCSEYFVPVEWLQTVPVEKAFNEVGLFGNQNTVCKPTAPKWRATVERLKKVFPQFDDESAGSSNRQAARHSP